MTFRRQIKLAYLIGIVALMVFALDVLAIRREVYGTGLTAGGSSAIGVIAAFTWFIAWFWFGLARQLARWSWHDGLRTAAPPRSLLRGPFAGFQRWMLHVDRNGDDLDGLRGTPQPANIGKQDA